jgi:hypothetical protein
MRFSKTGGNQPSFKMRTRPMKTEIKRVRQELRKMYQKEKLHPESMITS